MPFLPFHLVVFGSRGGKCLGVGLGMAYRGKSCRILRMLYCRLYYGEGEEYDCWGFVLDSYAGTQSGLACLVALVSRVPLRPSLPGRHQSQCCKIEVQATVLFLQERCLTPDCSLARANSRPYLIKKQDWKRALGNPVHIC